MEGDGRSSQLITHTRGLADVLQIKKKQVTFEASAV
jgi:hypothetical protein